MTDAFGLLALSEVLRTKGDFAGAMQVVDKFETRLQSPSRPHEFNEPFRTQRVRLQLASGNLESASRWADQILLSEDYHLHKEYYKLTLALIRLAQGRYTDVEALVADLPSPDLAGNRIARQLEINLLIAAAIAGQGRLPEALRLIDSCLALAEPEGYVRVFLDAGEAGQELLAAYLKSDAPGHKLYAQKLLGVISPLKGAVSAGSQPPGLIEPLSARETEVLRLMAQGKTNQEIARQFVVARGTVKAQAASIYRKLDAANRTEAVARARELGILP